MNISYDKDKKRVFIDHWQGDIDIQKDGSVCIGLEVEGYLATIDITSDELRRLADAADWLKRLNFKRYGEQSMPKIDGVTFRCEVCRANVFTIIDKGIYQCNGCHSEYKGE